MFREEIRLIIWGWRAKTKPTADGVRPSSRRDLLKSDLENCFLSDEKGRWLWCMSWGGAVVGHLKEGPIMKRQLTGGKSC